MHSHFGFHVIGTLNYNLSYFIFKEKFSGGVLHRVRDQVFSLIPTHYPRTWNSSPLLELRDGWLLLTQFMVTLIVVNIKSNFFFHNGNLKLSELITNQWIERLQKRKQCLLQQLA